MIIKFEPVYFDKIWGGDDFSRQFNYSTGPLCGEAWGISAHPSGQSKIKNGLYQGMSLKTLFDTHKELFGHYSGTEFPILVKLISAQDDLSIQVHPNDSYAKQFDSLGKEECWYVLHAQPNAELLIGHDASTKEELQHAIGNGTILDRMHHVSIHEGDFFYIEAGTIHAIMKGTLLLEVQQSSDLTFRLFDYNRQQNGKSRELHIEDGLACAKIPDNKLIRTPKSTYFQFDLLHNDNVCNQHSSIHGDFIFIIQGEGMFDSEQVKAGDFLMIPANQAYTVIGKLLYQKTTF